ncbi:MAG: aminotransferase class I/II-fold pyridoxal phosphate-dependent enzyme [Candidatus Heimdallarchaeota archaeon]|nr:aminotransferase class I/II-fold pyridoxal phosphate-dependent enzyme [Candidatus Heimdallarchaeota archaeon]
MNFFSKFASREILAQIKMGKEIGIYPYFKELNSEQGSIVKMNGKEIIMLGSNNYLGMTTHPEVKKRAKQAIDEYGVGSTGSRLLNGTMRLHVELEQRLAEFLGKEKAVIFSTGMQANLGTLSCLLEEDTWVISDEQNHASIIDGIRLGRMPRSNKKIYNHCDMDDLKRCLKEVPNGENALIVTDGVFSMEGDIAPLKEITELAEEFGAGVYVDDAHSIGVLGPNGRGTAAHFGLTDEVDIIMGTFSKSFASIGGFIAGSEPVCEWIRHSARSLIFSASAPPAAVATVLAVLDIIENDDSIRKQLWRNVDRLREGYLDAGFDIGRSETPIIPIIIGEEFKTFHFFKSLLEDEPRGVYTNPVRAPATPPGRELTRTSCLASLTSDIIDEAVEILAKNAQELEIIE